MSTWNINNSWHDYTDGHTFDFVSSLTNFSLDFFWDDNSSLVLMWLNPVKELFHNTANDFKLLSILSQVLCSLSGI